MGTEYHGGHALSALGPPLTSAPFPVIIPLCVPPPICQMSTPPWPPTFTLDQERILSLLTGDRFYSNPSAALREAILNAIDAVHRRRHRKPDLPPDICVTFNRDNLRLTLADNGLGMDRQDVSVLFTKVGASAATAETHKDSVGEFGIGVISYFMAADVFSLQTYDGTTTPLGLSFRREMLAGGEATSLSPTRDSQGTTLVLHLRDMATFDLLLAQFPHWCRDVEGLSAELLPDRRTLAQMGTYAQDDGLDIDLPHWVDRAHLRPVSNPPGWDAMTEVSTVAVLYRGVFVQEFNVEGAWGIEGSIDVDPKHFKPRLNRESFVESQFQEEVTQLLKSCHPAILEAMAHRLAVSIREHKLDKWTVKRWASLWLLLPRTSQYTTAIRAWDSVFRSLPAFEQAVGDKWVPASLETITTLQPEVFVAPLAEGKTNDIVQAAVRFLRNTGRPVIRGIRRDQSWMRAVGTSFGTTADLITQVFAEELPRLVLLTSAAAAILAGIECEATLYRTPQTDLVKLGSDSPPVLRVGPRLLINIDCDAGRTLVDHTLRLNAGPMTMVGTAARHAYSQLTQVAAAIRDTPGDEEILGPVRRRYIRSLLP